MITPYKPRRDVRPHYPTVLDIETDHEGNVIGVGVAYEDKDGRAVELFNNWDEWYRWYVPFLTKMKNATRYREIYAHYGANFDWVSFIQWAESSGILTKMEYILSGSDGIGVNAKIGSTIVRLRDSYRLLPASLDDLTKTFNVEHKKISLDDRLPHEIKDNDPVAFWEYLTFDLLGLQEVIFSFWSLIYQQVGSIENLPMTLPSLAMKLWRMTLEKPMNVTWNDEVKRLERRAYTGGRTECYTAGEADVTIYDANSEYPSVMKAGVFPISYRGGWTDVYEGKHGVYEVAYEQPDRTYKPVLRDELSGEFRYSGRGVYTKPELDMLLERGGSFTVITGWVYVDVGNPFEAFIDRWWAIRRDAQQRGDAALAFICKILMNSLYGKFGQQEKGWVLKRLSPAEQITLMSAGVEIQAAGDFTLVHEARRAEYTFAGLAAYVTAYGRLHLYREMCAATDAGHRLWAVDTDSVHVSGGEPLPTGNDLGEWKIEYVGLAAYAGKKLYALKGGKIKAKGIGKSATPVLTYAQFKRLADHPTSSLTVTFTAMPSIRDVLIRGVQSAKMVERQRTIRATARAS